MVVGTKTYIIKAKHIIIPSPSHMVRVSSNTAIHGFLVVSQCHS